METCQDCREVFGHEEMLTQGLAQTGPTSPIAETRGSLTLCSQASTARDLSEPPDQAVFDVALGFPL